MKAFRTSDGYVEVTSISMGEMVEIYITMPGSEQVLRVHIPEKIAARLSLWLVKYFLFERFLGLKTMFQSLKQQFAFARGVRIERENL